jgi:phosphotransferase system IIB component
VDLDPWLAALGGRDNLRSCGACDRRLYLEMISAEAVDEAALGRLGVRATGWPRGESLHLLLAHDAEPLSTALHARGVPSAGPSRVHT